MRRSNAITIVMFATVGILLLVTVVLGVVTVINNNKNNKGNETPIAQTTTAPDPGETVSAAPLATSTPTSTPVPTDTPTPTTTPTPKALVCLDPGHQMSADFKTEPVGPGSETTVPRMATNGTISAANGEAEYQWNMYISDLIKDELRLRGYEVILTRTTNEENVSNMERALFANDNKADILVGIQTDAYSDESVHGVYAQIPAANNPFVGNLAADSEKLATAIRDAVVNATSAKSRSFQYGDGKLAVINWAKMPVCIMQLGYMSNPDEAALLADPDYQKKIVRAVCDGIDAYFAGKNQ